MIQKKWFRIETDGEGNILSCEEVSSKDRRLASGLCTRCGERKPDNARYCEPCRERINSRRRELTSRKKADENRKRWGGSYAWESSRILKKFDSLGSARFRESLCDRIRKAGGGAALDEYERERAKQADASKRYSKRYPPEAAE